VAIDQGYAFFFRTWSPNFVKKLTRSGVTFQIRQKQESASQGYGMGMQGMWSHPQRWKIGRYSGKNFEDLGKFYSYIHISLRQCLQ